MKFIYCVLPIFIIFCFFIVYKNNIISQKAILSSHRNSINMLQNKINATSRPVVVNAKSKGIFKPLNQVVALQVVKSLLESCRLYVYEITPLNIDNYQHIYKLHFSASTNQLKGFFYALQSQKYCFDADSFSFQKIENKKIEAEVVLRIFDDCKNKKINYFSAADFQWLGVIKVNNVLKGLLLMPNGLIRIIKKGDKIIDINGEVLQLSDKFIVINSPSEQIVLEF